MDRRFLLYRKTDIRYTPSMEKLWEIQRPRPDRVQRLAETARIDPILAALLVNRNIEDAGEVESFLFPRLIHLRPPFGLKDVDRASERIVRALFNHEKILIFGDYDADGVTAAAVVFDFLKSLSADVSVYLPHRLKEGYGLRAEHVADQIRPRQYGLVLTVDCGSGSHDAVAAAARAGIDVIVTDHHRIDAPLPQALAVVNPNRPDCTSGLGHLAGVGVAFYLIIVLRHRLREHGFWKSRPEPNLRDYCDLVTLGTIADMAPMIRENRILVREGLSLIQSGRREGLRALIEASGSDPSSLDAESIAFRLSPRINAAGRIGHAGLAFDLIQETDPHEAREKAGRLNTLNAERRRIEITMLRKIDETLHRHPDLLKRRTLVLSDPEWHEGILGIVAAKLVEKYHRMVVLISTRNGMGKGSARGVPGLDLFHFMSRCREVLEDFGGHETAAGLRLKEKEIPSFGRLLEEAVSGGSSPEDFIPRLAIDCELPFERITPELMEALEWLKPHGPGNPPPRFMAADVRVVSSRILGDAHRKMRLAQGPGSRTPIIDAIQFHADPAGVARTAFSRIAYRPAWNTWNGKKTLQAVVEEAV